MTDEPAIKTAGGWCAPSETIYDLADLRGNLFSAVGLPIPGVTRGLKYQWHEPTEADRLRWKAEDAYRAFIQRHIKEHIGNIDIAKHHAVSEALADATNNGWELWTHDSTTSRFVGIGFKPGPVTLHRLDAEHGDYYNRRGYDADDWIDAFEEDW